MNKFNLIESSETIEVRIRGNVYPVIKAGKGIPCLLICLGTPSFRTLSRNFAEHFEIYSSDMYWIKNSSSIDLNELTMDTIIDDIKALGDALKLKQYIIFAHSAYGIIALEFAKKYPDIAKGIVMVGTPVNSNQKTLEINNSLFNQLAEPTRKAIDQKRREELKKEDLSQLTLQQRWLREYIYRDAPRYWHIPDFDCAELWEGVHLDKTFIKLFEEILPKTDVLQSLEKIRTPIFLAAGKSDYDCCPWMWKEVKNLPSRFIVGDFTQSGHWPHYEEADKFDHEIINWTQSL